MIALATASLSPAAAPEILRGGLAGLVLFGICGAALALALVPPAWGAAVPLIAAPLGAASSGLLLTALGFARIPLDVTLWLVLAAGLLGWALVLRHRRRAPPRGSGVDPRVLASWLAALAVVFLLALIPAWKTGVATVYGENPDSHQVVGIAVLFQHVPPTGTDVRQPIDTVPPAWRFRYPIFYPLAAASNLTHQDPIQVFPAMAVLLLLIAAAGFGLFVVRCLRAPPIAGPLVALAIGVARVPLHLVWHPYWNQLWGLALLPYALLFGWCALRDRDVRLGALCALMVVTLALAYPLALPDALVLLLALCVGYGRRPRPLAVARSRSWALGLLAVLVLAPALAGAAVKLYQGVTQLFDSRSALWGGDVTQFLPVGRFVGTGGGALPALAVGVVALTGLRGSSRRVALAFGLGVLILGLVDIRFRVTSSGSYMDFKQLSYVGTIVLALAAAGVVSLLASRRTPLVVAGTALALGWAVAAGFQGRQEIHDIGAQVPPPLLEVRDWGRRLPPGSSVRVDIPASGVQLWAVYMLAAHPVNSPTPVIYTTYAHAPYGTRADYSLSLRFYFRSSPRERLRPYPRPPFARDPPLFENSQFVLRRIAWPRRLAAVTDTASLRLVEP